MTGYVVRPINYTGKSLERHFLGTAVSSLIRRTINTMAALQDIFWDVNFPFLSVMSCPYHHSWTHGMPHPPSCCHWRFLAMPLSAARAPLFINSLHNHWEALAWVRGRLKCHSLCSRLLREMCLQSIETGRGYLHCQLIWSSSPPAFFPRLLGHQFSNLEPSSLLPPTKTIATTHEEVKIPISGC